jgi:hypothetical protein
MKSPALLNLRRFENAGLFLPQEIETDAMKATQRSFPYRGTVRGADAVRIRRFKKGSEHEDVRHSREKRVIEVPVR